MQKSKRSHNGKHFTIIIHAHIKLPSPSLQHSGAIVERLRAIVDCPVIFANLKMKALW